MKKTSLIVSLLIVFTIALTACAPKADTVAVEESGFRVAYLTDLGGLAGSDEVKGFSDLGWDAALQAVDELGIEAVVLEANELADLEPNLVKMAEEGYDLLVCGGFLFSDAVSAVAPLYPDTMFAVIDGYASGDNVQNIGFASNEGSFLVGALAAGMTETGTIAFIGGMEGPLIEAFEAGYIAGARAINPDIEVLSGYTGSFTDVAAGKELALAQYAQGGDVNYAAAGACVFGAIEAAEENGFYAIGVDTDMDHLAPNNVLSSMLKHVQVGTFITIKQAFEGNFQPGFITYTLADGTIGYTKSAEMASVVPAELYAAVDALADKINAGEIVVPVTVAEANVFTLE
ncbi:MAG: BMP family ABC transporter substrate-binding protein [Pelolinea sp.]|nr:BMP family ABC transporter substrate-binding protein [Pelolinea sp.]